MGKRARRRSGPGTGAPRPQPRRSGLIRRQDWRAVMRGSLKLDRPMFDFFLASLSLFPHLGNGGENLPASCSPVSAPESNWPGFHQLVRM